MKNTILFLAIFFSCAQMSAKKDTLDVLFDRYQNAAGVTSIKILKPMFGTLGNIGLQNDELKSIKPLLSRLTSLRMLVLKKPTFPAELLSENIVPLNKYEKLAGDILSELKKMNYEESLSMAGNGYKIRIFSPSAKDGFFNNLMMDIDSGESRTLMLLGGKISTEDMNALIADTTENAKSPGKNTAVNRVDSEERKVAPFTGINASLGVRVVYTQGPVQSVRVETDVDKLKYVETVVEGGILRISIKNNDNENLNFKKLLISVTSPVLKYLKAETGANVSSKSTVKGNEFYIESESGSNICLALKAEKNITVDANSGSKITLDMVSPMLKFDGNSGSNAELKGQVEQATFDVNSAGRCNAAALSVRAVRADVSSAGNLTANVSKTLTAEVSSGGVLSYKGSPALQNETTGGGIIRKLD